MPLSSIYHYFINYFQFFTLILLLFTCFNIFNSLKSAKQKFNLGLFNQNLFLYINVFNIFSIVYFQLTSLLFFVSLTRPQLHF